MLELSKKISELCDLSSERRKISFHTNHNFIKLCTILWKNHVDMNCDGGSPDFETLESIRESDYIKTMLEYVVVLLEAEDQLSYNLEHDIKFAEWR